ncbi:uncharacterized protein [Clytia hemisphaerica]|uniref:BRICHOS domain-containing protein n=1 Tax=Clytia hemisphaerica TaxID=252671 RepID=A0A7M5WJZ8_9CNID
MPLLSHGIISLACIVLVIQGQLYDLEFKENGQTYKEMITVDKDNQILVFDVPNHGNRGAATYLKDFINRLTVMRDDETKTCYVWKMKKDEPTPDSVLKALKKVNYKFPQNRYWIETENMIPMQPFDLSPYPIIDQFCDKRRALEVKVYANITEMEREVKADLLSHHLNNRGKRQATGVDYTLCQGEESKFLTAIQECKKKRRPDLLYLKCKILLSPHCTYVVSCKKIPGNKWQCPKPVHSFTQLHCCAFKCAA